jgi:DNA-binding NtrC family response regulator
MSPDKTHKNWRELAEKAAHEQDSDKLYALVRELSEALDQQTKGTRTSTPRPTPKQLSKRLLFVDDEEGIRITLSALLQQRGFDVRVAASVPEALSEISTRQFDALLSDLNIGQDGDGFTVVQAMRKVHPAAVTILLTGYPAFESALQAIHDEVDDYFVKPADLDSLTNTIERKLRTRQDHC